MLLDLNCSRKQPVEGKPCKWYEKGRKGEAGFCMLRIEFICREALKRYLPHLSTSLFNLWSGCRMAYYYYQILGIGLRYEKLPDRMKAGAIWDNYLQQLYGGDGLPPDIYQPDPYLLARVNALAQAMERLEIVVDKNCTCQHQFDIMLKPRIHVSGHIDRAYENYFVESKLSSRPEYYFWPHNIHQQVGTYFLSNPDYQYCIMEVVRLPQQRTGKGKYDEEEPEEFQQRIYRDIIKRPSYYFVKFDRKKRTFGIKFMRSEFDLESLKQEYIAVWHDIQDCIKHDRWYRNRKFCRVPDNCFYLPICESGTINDELYYRREKKSGVL